MSTRRSTRGYVEYPVEGVKVLSLSRKDALDLLAAVELAPFEHETLEQKLLDFLSESSDSCVPARN